MLTVLSSLRQNLWFCALCRSVEDSGLLVSRDSIFSSHHSVKALEFQIYLPLRLTLHGFGGLKFRSSRSQLQFLFLSFFFYSLYNLEIYVVQISKCKSFSDFEMMCTFGLLLDPLFPRNSTIFFFFVSIMASVVLLVSVRFRKHLQLWVSLARMNNSRNHSLVKFFQPLSLSLDSTFWNEFL